MKEQLLNTIADEISNIFTVGLCGDFFKVDLTKLSKEQLTFLEDAYNDDDDFGNDHGELDHICKHFGYRVDLSYDRTNEEYLYKFSDGSGIYCAGYSWDVVETILKSSQFEKTLKEKIRRLMRNS